MKYRHIKKVLNRYKKQYRFLKQFNIDIKLVSDLNEIGYFSTKDPDNKFIGISTEFALKNNLKFLKGVIGHELAHSLDYVLNNGWRLDNSDPPQIIYHDELFANLCKLTGGIVSIDEKYINFPKKLFKKDK